MAGVEACGREFVAQAGEGGQAHVDSQRDAGAEQAGIVDAEFVVRPAAVGR